MEYKFGKEIDELILDSLISSKGQQKEASKILDISEATMCRWVQKLDLTKKFTRIRKSNGLQPTISGLTEQTDDGREVLEFAIISRCTECNAKFEDLTFHRVTYINTDKDKNPYAVVRDQLKRKHWFELDLSNAPT